MRIRGLNKIHPKVGWRQHRARDSKGRGGGRCVCFVCESVNIFERPGDSRELGRQWQDRGRQGMGNSRCEGRGGLHTQTDSHVCMLVRQEDRKTRMTDWMYRGDVQARADVMLRTAAAAVPDHRPRRSCSCCACARSTTACLCG
jgi:hypothetical protein